MSAQLPYLTIVATGRNDNHGGNLLKRMQLFASGVVEQAERHRVPVELILVEWNPPTDKPPLAEVIKWPETREFTRIKIVQFPPHLHAKFKHAAHLPLYQMIAKNVGIRRATAPFILVTNIDILFSDEIFQFFAAGELEPGKLYRTSRFDADENIPGDVTLDEQLRFCRENTVRINHERGSKNLIDGRYFRHCADDIELISDELEYPRLFTNACGDFQLMAREHWFKLRGYPEFDMYSFHIDSVLEYMAYYDGICEVSLGEPFRIYHIEHQSGWTPESQKDGSFDNRYQEQKIRKLADSELREIRNAMHENKAATIFNDVNWGWADVNLPEHSI